MRTAFTVGLLLGAAALIHAQPAEPEARYKVKARIKQFPQSTPKEALKSALAAIDKADYAYLAAHLLDPKFVDDAVKERIPLFEAAANLELAQLRDFQIANPGRVAIADRVPLDPRAFQAMVLANARERAFKQLQNDIAQKFEEDPQSIKDMRRILREGDFNAGEPATAAHPEVKGRVLFFTQDDGRWFIQNRQADEKKD